MKVRWERAAEKRLAKLGPKVARKIVAAVQAYADGERQGHIKKLEGQHAGESRLRVGKWRVKYKRDRDVLTVVDVVDRRDAY